MLGKTSGIDFYKFTEVDYSGNNAVEISDFNLTVDVTSGTPITLKPFTLPATIKDGTEYYKYLLPAITQVDYTSLTITNSGVALGLINNGDLRKKGLHFLKLYDDSKSYSLTIAAEFDGTNASPITFLSPIRFSEEDERLLYTTDGAPTDLFQKLQALDYDNQFNYGYVVPDDKLIEDPLTAASFLDPNHPYNRATICRWNHKAEASSIKVTNKIK